MQSGENSHSLLNARFQRMDIPSTHLPEKSPCFDRRQPPERRQTSDIGSIEKLLAPDLMQTPEKINILGMKTSKDMKVLGINRAYDKLSTSGMMQHPETKPNSEIILVSEVLSGFDSKNIGIFDANQLQPKELHAEILLDRPGPSGVRTLQEFQQRADVMGPPTPMSSADVVVSPDVLTAQGEPSQRSTRDVVREILSLLSGYTHGIPYPITKYYLESAGFNNFSPDIVQLVGLTAQKYIYDILCDAMQNSKERIARENAERGGGSGGVPLTLAYADLAPALKKYKDNKNLNYMKKKDSILASFRKLLNKRNTSSDDEKNDIAITKIKKLLEKIDLYSHTGYNQTNHLNDEVNDSDDESMSDSEVEDESLTDTSTCSTSTPTPTPTSISTSNATNSASLSSSTSTDDIDDDECVNDGEDVDDVEDVSNDDDYDDDEIDDDDGNDDDDDGNDDDDDDDDDDYDDDDVTSINALQPSRERREVRKIDNLDRPERRVQDLINIFRNASRTKNSEGGKDECDQFGALLAEKLKKLDIQHREEIMSEIDSLLLTKVK